MGKGIFIALLNPAISAIFAGGFFILWRYQRERRYIGVLALSYLACTCGFLLQCVTLPVGTELTKLASNSFFVITAYTMAAGILDRFGRRPPHVALSLLGVGGLLALSWFLFVEPDMSWRVLAINVALAGISLVAAAELRQVPGKSFVDRLLMVTLLLAGINLLVRPLAIIAIVGPPAGEGDVFMSVYWIATSVSHAFYSVLLAVCMITAIALDVIGKLQSDALSDPLSGLLNRRGFEERGSEILARSSIGGMPVALVLTDLDHFKRINDTYGHACGDRVIAAFARLLRDAAGQEGVAGRIGGEEFAVILPGCGLASARLFAEGVRASCGGVMVAGVSTGTSITASFGVAEWMEDESLTALLGRADVALYQAKHGGRDRVAIVSGAVTMPERRSRRMAKIG